MAHRLMIILAASIVLLSAAPAPHGVPGPIAVAAFRNLASDSTLDWLGSGIAETMVTDLKSGGTVRVVERDRVDEAMRELALQSKASAIEESTAARIGRLVGAKTIVVGSYQSTGGELRINARFVAVETGEVLDTAKVTGAATKIFLLQDQIVARLLGSPAAHPKRKEGAKAFEAYHLYAMAMTTANDADRSGFLHQSLDLDPDFVYAKDALAELEKRMAGYREENETAIQKSLRNARKTLDDPAASSNDRYIATTQLLSTELSHRLYFSAIDDAKHVAELNLPPFVAGTDPPRAYALFVLLNCYSVTARPDLALQAGEQYMKEFPSGTYFGSADNLMKQAIATRSAQERAHAAIKEKLAAIDAKLSALPASATEVNRESVDFDHCRAGVDVALPAFDVAVDQCGAFVARWAGKRANDIFVTEARALRVQALAGVGRYKEAIALGDAVMTDEPDSIAASMIKGMREAWPADAR